MTLAAKTAIVVTPTSPRAFIESAGALAPDVYYACTVCDVSIVCNVYEAYNDLIRVYYFDEPLLRRRHA